MPTAITKEFISKQPQKITFSLKSFQDLLITAVLNNMDASFTLNGIELVCGATTSGIGPLEHTSYACTHAVLRLLVPSRLKDLTLASEVKLSLDEVKGYIVKELQLQDVLAENVATELTFNVQNISDDRYSTPGNYQITSVYLQVL